ncbi:3'(2'),5'-bisphosphate nucleotidase CysQ family protein [Chondromyces apiculatus]|uniref:3'(2'),5-bisphosphonucleoside 3'(2')-phosphohydrolase n=1 Tax=Chondromyces apiculatus DSM 436 TaxID=1192034 RepID=A0A017SYA8_9BACT|nr:3'(2'),5'-bisphosphate nucleotidase CysQ [Chondromyces apiculatus]EYF01291.1 putative 3'(2'),5'-bisphosphate nucleotidase [Chondromyces apiculatus DSM 436]
MQEHERELAELLRIGREASHLVMEVYATPFTVDLKGPDDPVTQADRRANDLICGAIEAAFPGEAILAEESVPSDPAEIAALARQPRVFYVDPLDGTREFANRNGEFAVMIGLSIAGRAALGVLVLPTTGEALVGWSLPEASAQASAHASVQASAHASVQAPHGSEALQGAFLEAPDGSRSPLRVSTTRTPSEAAAVISRSHPHPSLRPLLDRLGIGRVVQCGSVGVKVARVVTRAADLYVHTGTGAKLWDTCAPEAVLRGAGGAFSDLHGDPIGYGGPDLVLSRGIVATNGALHDAVLAAARPALS